MRQLMLALLVVMAGAAQAQPAATIALRSPLPLDTAIYAGKLANGLSYFIRINHKPEHRAELRLVVNAGSILEDDDQRGLAHFTEHMAFNGTRHFGRQALVDYLESVGVRFGADLNAATGFDETTYKLQVPTDTPAIVHKGFDILEDWSHEVLFTDDEIEKERGVILEEWRLGLGADTRIRDKQLPVIFFGSRYAERLPIGLKETIERAPHDRIRQFYHDWYRPELMAVVVVGDVEPDSIRNLITEHFGNLVPASQPRPRKEFPVPSLSNTRVSIATDPEETMTTVSVFYPRSVESDTLVQDYRRSIVERLCAVMLNLRFEETGRTPDAPFVYASGGRGPMVRTEDAFVLDALVKTGGVRKGLDALMREAARVRKFGFTEGELDRTKAELLRDMENEYAERDKSESSAFVRELVDHFLVHEPAPGIGYEFALHQRFLPEITLAEVNTLASSWITKDNRIITVSGPSNDSASIPTVGALTDLVNAIDTLSVGPYQDRTTTSPLMEKLPVAGTVVSRSHRDDVSVTEWKLSNGIRVLLKPTVFKNDEVIFSIFSPGGSSLVPDSLYLAASTASAILQESGLANFDKTILEKLLAAKVVSVTPFISDFSQGIGGSASPKDLETMFQLIYLQATAPRADAQAFDTFTNRIKTFIENRSARPESAFEDTVQAVMSQHHFRRRPVTLEMLRELDLQRSLALYKQRFADVGGSTAIIVGSFDLKSIEPLVVRYLGSLPPPAHKTAWRDIGINPPKGVIERTVCRGLDPKAQVRIIFTGPFVWNRENRYAMNALSEVLSIRLRELLREDKGGTYGVSVRSIPTKIPEPQFQFSISFGCDPTRVQELIAATYLEIDSLQQIGPSTVDVNKVKEMDMREREVTVKKNSFWLSAIRSCEENDIDLAQILTYRQLIEHITPEVVKAAARSYMPKDRVATFIQLPESGDRK